MHITELLAKSVEREGELPPHQLFTAKASLMAFRCFSLVLKVVLCMITPGNTFTTWKDLSAPLLRIDWRLTRKANGHSEKKFEGQK